MFNKRKKILLPRTDLITPDECVEILKESEALKEAREIEVKAKGYPAYTTEVGWLGYSMRKVKNLCEDFRKKGFSAFKIKVGQNVEDDIERCQNVRQAIGSQNLLVI